ncbi:MAG TPA: LamG-like jellyroll fold domain-containing protein [Verrucomicrobiae bacterium]
MKTTGSNAVPENAPHGKRRTSLVRTSRLALASLLIVNAWPALADRLTTSVALTDYLTYGISPLDGPRGYGIEAGGISNIVSAGLLYRGDYVPGQWGYWTYSEYGTTAQYNPVQTGIMGGLVAKLDPAGMPLSPGGMSGMVIASGGNPPRIKFLSVPGTLRQSGLATLWVLHSWSDPSPWAGTTPPGGPGWGGYTWEPRFWGYSSALILEHATSPAPQVRGAGNGDFQTGDLEGWTSFAPDTGSVQIVTFPAGSTNFAAQLTTRRLAAITQLTLEGVDLGFLEFDYLFLTNRGRLEVSLGGYTLGVIQAADPVTNTMQHARLPVPAAVNRAWEPLVFELTGDAGEQVLLDNVGWLSALRILQVGAPQTVSNAQVLPLEIQCLTNESCYVQVAPTLTGPWQALVTPFPVTADPMNVPVPILAGWPRAFYRLGLWQELKLVSLPQNSTAFAGVADGSLSVTPSGTGPFSYQWRRGGTNLPGQTSATLNLLNPQAADAGNYTVIITDAAGVSITSAPPATLEVQPFAAPEGWWPGDGHYLDLAPGGIPVVPEGGPLFGEGKVGQGFVFSGNERGFVSAMFPFHQPGDASLVCWLRPDSSGNQSVIWTRPDSTDVNRFNFSLHDGSFWCDYRSPNGSLQFEFGVPVAGGVWTMVAVVRAGNTYSICTNGVLATQTTDAAPDLPTAAGWQMSGRSGFMFQGGLDEVMLFSRALSAAEVRALHAAGGAGLHR